MATKARQINDYVLVLDSLGRQDVSNTEPNSYTISWPKIAPGKYRADLQITDKSATVNSHALGLYMRSPCIINHLSTFENEAMRCVLVLDNFRSEGVCYLQDPEGQVDVKIVNLQDQQLSDIGEHIVLMHLTKIGARD